MGSHGILPVVPDGRSCPRVKVKRCATVPRKHPSRTTADPQWLRFRVPQRSEHISALGTSSSGCSAATRSCEMSMSTGEAVRVAARFTAPHAV